MKRGIAFAFMIMAVLLPAVAQSTGKQYQMVSVPKLRAAWFDDLEQGLLKAGKDFNIKVWQQAPAAADEAQQVRLIEDSINQGVDALLVVPNDAKSIEPSLARAKAQKIVTITHESANQKNADIDVEMIENVSFGRTMLEKMVSAMGTTEGEYVIYVGSLTVPAHNQWADAAVALAKQKYPKLVQIASRYPVSEDQNSARQTALDIITAHPNIKGFLCFGSQGGPGAAQAVREKGLIGKIAVCGMATPMQAAQYLKDGSLSYSILWRPAEAGYAMTYLAKLVLDGKKADIYKVGFEIPSLGKPISVKGNTILFDRPMILEKSNVDSFNF